MTKNNETDLLEFVNNRMSMSAIYQPLIIRELIEHGGECTIRDLAKAFAKHDLSTVEYYENIVKRYPKQTLLKHGVIEYDKTLKSFRLKNYSVSKQYRESVIEACEAAMSEWIEKQNREGDPSVDSSIRYILLKESGGRCQLCGITSSLSPLEIDHIVPQSLAQKGKVRKDEIWIDVHSKENLQVLCASCNRGKRAGDNTDFKKSNKLVRDKIPDIIRKEGRDPDISELSPKQHLNALYEKLSEEYREFLDEYDLEELADMTEVIVSIARLKGKSESEFFDLMYKKREKAGSFNKGYFYKGDKI